MGSPPSAANMAVPGPEWVIGEMPPGYQNRVIDIQRMLADLETMGQFGGLLYQVGPALGQVVRNLFHAFKLDAELIPDTAVPAVSVRLDAKRRLLLYPSAATAVIERKSPEVARLFQLLHEVAEDSDRVVLVTNTQPTTRPSDRTAALTPDALAFLVRMGAGHLTGPTLFALWKLWLGDSAVARAQVDRFYSAPAGTVELSAAATR